MSNKETGKVCSKCERWKSLEEFSKSKKGKSGRKSSCKACQQEYNTKWIIQLKERGLCIDCAKVLAKKGKTQCEGCVEKAKKRRSELKEKGLCISCIKTSVKKGSTRCENCLERKNKNAKKNYDYEKVREKQKRYREENLFYVNDLSRRAEQIRKEKRILNGLCSACGKEEPILEQTVCETCWYKYMANNVLGKTSLWRRLREIVNRQDNKCAISGVDLIPGKNLSFDHIEPVSVNPQRRHELANIQAVALTLNYMKDRCSQKDFDDLIKLLYKRKNGDDVEASKSLYKLLSEGKKDKRREREVVIKLNIV